MMTRHPNPSPEDADVATVRAGLLDTSNAIVANTMTETAFNGLSALDRLAARLQEAERERDEARRHSPHPVGDWFALSRRAEAAEAREKALREALKTTLPLIEHAFRASGDNMTPVHLLHAALATANPEATE